MQVGRGVAYKLAGAVNTIHEHGPPAADALRQHGEQQAKDLHQGPPSMCSGDQGSARSAHAREQQSGCELEQYTLRIAVSVLYPSAHPISDTRDSRLACNRDLGRNDTIPEICLT